MAAEARVLGTGVRIERHPDPESDLETHAELEAYGRGEIAYVRAIAFVDVGLDGARHRWEWTPSRPAPVRLGQPATAALVDLARDVESNTRGRLLADARVAGLRVSRWDVESAPRRIELETSLRAQLRLE